jgi:outer membrane protein OmpA-like peptidoglycan-associated protein
MPLARGLAIALLLACACALPARAADDASLAEMAQLNARLAALDADPALAGRAGLERYRARATLDAAAVARSRDRAHALYLARARVASAELAAQAEVLLQQSAQLDRERDQIELEASRRQALAAQREADRLRRQALAREEEAQREAEAMAAERAQLEESSATADAAAEQAMKLAEARAEETRLARKEAELAAALNGDAPAAGKPAAASKPASAPLPARSAGKRTVYTLPGTAFASGSATLAPSAIASLRSLFSAIGAKKTLRVEAHTDNQGPDAANLVLSQKRADAVKRALVDAGIGAARIRAVGKGEASPVADNASADGRARNRRVEIVVE